MPRDKSIEERLQAAQEQLYVISINQHLKELLEKSEPPHVCQGSDCPENDANSCHGHTGCKGDGSCGGHHAKEYDASGNDIKTKALGSDSTNIGRIVTDDGEVITGFYLPKY